jgi:pyruvyl transferase EpsO
MSALKRRHAALAAEIPRDRKVVYLDYALTKNVGDLLITLGTLEFFRESGVEVRAYGSWKNTLPRDRMGVRPGDVIVMQGGGNFGDLYPHFQAYRERIVAEYPDHKVVIFPQTIHFRDPENLKRSAERLNRHPDLLLFVRDQPSLELAAPLFGERARLVPDMAHHLWPGLHDLPRDDGAKGALESLFFIRRDGEGGRSYPSLRPFEQGAVDWADATPVSLKLRKRAFIALGEVETRLGLRARLDGLYFQGVRSDCRRVMRALDKGDLWITSRLHGMIIGLLLGKPVAAIDNSYGKLSGYIETWRNELDPILLIDDEATANRVAGLVGDLPQLDRGGLWRRYRELAKAGAGA